MSRFFRSRAMATSMAPTRTKAALSGTDSNAVSRCIAPIGSNRRTKWDVNVSHLFSAGYNCRVLVFPPREGRARTLCCTTFPMLRGRDEVYWENSSAAARHSAPWAVWTREISYGAGLKATATEDQLPVARPAYMVCQVMETGEVPVVM
jgi:hypothetical protein